MHRNHKASNDTPTVWTALFAALLLIQIPFSVWQSGRWSVSYDRRSSCWGPNTAAQFNICFLVNPSDHLQAFDVNCLLCIFNIKPVVHTSFISCTWLLDYMCLCKAFPDHRMATKAFYRVWMCVPGSVRSIMSLLSPSSWVLAAHYHWSQYHYLLINGRMNGQHHQYQHTDSFRSRK